MRRRCRTLVCHVNECVHNCVLAMKLLGLKSSLGVCTGNMPVWVEVGGWGGVSKNLWHTGGQIWDFWPGHSNWCSGPRGLQ